MSFANQVDTSLLDSQDMFVSQRLILVDVTNVIFLASDKCKVIFREVIKRL